MNQMNNNKEYFFDVNKLYDIASRLKNTDTERRGVKAVISKNPSRSMNERYDIATKEYQKALDDFGYFVDEYIIFERKEEISQVQLNKIINQINIDIDKVFEEYKKEEN